MSDRQAGEPSGNGTPAWPPPPTGAYQTVINVRILPPFRSVRVLCLTATIFLCVYLLMCMIAAGFELTQTVSGPNTALYRINSQCDSVQSLSFFPCALVFLIWMYRVCSNAIAFGAAGLPIGPGWAVGSFFVPIVAFFRPYQAVRDTWKASDPESDLSTDATMWKQAQSAPVVGWWWALWLSTNTLGLVATVMSFYREGSRASEAESFVSDAFSTASCIAAILLVRALSMRQEEKYRRLATPGPEVPA